MDKAVVLRLSENVKRFLSGNVAAVLLCLHHIVRHIPYRHAPALRIVGAALVMIKPGTAAGAGAFRIFALIFGQPVGNML